MPDNGQDAKMVKNDGFLALPVKYSEDSSVIRHLFVKQFLLNFHKNTNEDKPENRTLLVLNVPPFVTEHHIRHLFEKKCGKIVRIFLQEKPSLSTSTSVFNRIQSLSGDQEDMETDAEPLDFISKHFPSNDNQIMSYKVCYIVFNKPNGLANALKMTTDNVVYTLKPSTSEANETTNFLTGIKLWQKQYNDSIVAPWQAKKAADSFLEKHKKYVEEEDIREKARAEMGQEEDGWVTVNRKLRRDRQALVSNQYFDQKIQDKYTDRARKRKTEEEHFEESVNKSMLETGKKKSKGKLKVDFLADKDNWGRMAYLNNANEQVSSFEIQTKSHLFVGVVQNQALYCTR